MRLLTAATTALCLLLAASTAGAYQFNLVKTPGTTNPGGAESGGLVSYDILLDTEGESGIVAISFGVRFDDTALRYESGLSDANDYYPLYAPAGKTGTYLTPIANPWGLWNGDPPPGGEETVQIDFVAFGFTPTTATSTNEFLGTVVFTVLGAEGTSTEVEAVFSLPFGGHGFDIDDGAGGTVNVSDQVPLVFDASANPGETDDVSVVVVPEPTGALLAFAAIGTVGLLARRQARA